MNPPGDKKNNKSFIDWYESPYKQELKLGWWSDSDLEIAESAKSKSSKEYGVKEPVDAMNLAKNQASSGDWLLCFEIHGKNVKNINWMFVDFIVPVSTDDKDAYEEGHPYQGIQVHKLSQYPLPPFMLDKIFRAAFRNAAKEYGVEKIEKARKLVAPRSLINMVVGYL